MKIGWFTAKDELGSYFHEALTRGFDELDILYTPFVKGQDYDYVLIFNALLNTHNHDFSGIENILGKFAFIDFADYGWWVYHAHNAKEYYSAFTPSARAIRPQGNNKLINFLRGKSYPYFIREMFKNYPYHKNYHPVDYPLQASTFPIKYPGTFEEFRSRKWDLYLSWRPNHNFRVNITNEIKKLPFKILAICDSPPKFDYRTNLNFLEDSKFSVTYAGHGSGAIREYEVLSRCALLKNANMCTRQPFPVTDKITCFEYNVTERIIEKAPIFVSTNIGDVLADALSNLEKVYEVYINGFNYCMTYHTEKAAAQYILDILSKHDWNETTPE